MCVTFRFRHFYTSGSSPLERLPKLPVPPQPLEDQDLRYEIEREISDGGRCLSFKADALKYDVTSGMRRMLERMGGRASTGTAAKCSSTEDPDRPQPSDAAPCGASSVDVGFL